VTSSTVYDITVDLVSHEFQRTFCELRDLRVVDVVFSLPWLDDEQTFFPIRHDTSFTLMDGTTVETQIEERRLECRLMSSGKIQKLMRKTRRNRGRNAEFYVFEI
jgi:hypothetical protein